jgi:hypothetical protein
MKGERKGRRAKGTLINKLHVKGVVRLSGRAGLPAYYIRSIPS